METVDGKIAVVTGGASGVGLAMGRLFAEQGARVILADRRADALDEAVGALAADGLTAVEGIECDVTDLASVEALADAVFDRHGAAHVVCNNAGVGSGGEGFLWEHEINDWRWGFDVNVWGVIHGIKAFVPRMVEAGTDGHIVNTSSGNGGLAPFGDTAIYAVTKAAVVTITEVLYAHLVKSGSPVRASVLFPGPNWLRTQLWEAWRWRPEAYAKEKPRETPYPSMEMLEQMMEDAGIQIEFTPLEEVAQTVLDGILAEQFWMLPASEKSDESIRARADSMLARSNPTYFRDWKV